MRLRTWLIIALITLGLSGAFIVHRFLSTPAQPPLPVTMEIHPGDSAWEISLRLETHGVIDDARLFYLTAAATRKLRRLQAGTYVFSGNHLPREIMAVLFQGRTHQIKLTIPEGADLFMVADLASRTGIVSREEMLAAARAPETMAFFGIDAPSMEGFLYPDTYFISPNATPLEIMSRMVERFRDIYHPELTRQAQRLQLTRLEHIALASLIEKEAILNREKPIISSVFHNRLRRGMRLQSDPSAVYGLDGFHGRIRPKDLKRDTPYNTYLHAGLPRGPICNPGREAIVAAVQPSDTPYLYFVATGCGEHTFSASYREHRRAIRSRKNTR